MEKFENTIIIMMGCDGLRTQSMAEARLHGTFDAANNWWGQPSGPYHATKKAVEIWDIGYLHGWRGLIFVFGI